MPTNPNFSPTFSTNEIYRNVDDTRCLTDDLDTIESDIKLLENGKANVEHTHTGYAAAIHTHAQYADIDHEHSEYSLTTHTHSDYAAISHNHPEYALSSDVDAIQAQVGDTSVSAQISAALSSKADINHTHSEYANVSHTHNEYASVNHTHSYNDLTDKPTTSAPSLVDSVSEEGTYGSWTYRKWENGTSEAWYCENFGEVELKSLTAFGVWSNDSYSARSVNFPSGLFNSTPMVISNVYSSGYTFSQVASATKDSMVYRIWTSASATIDNVSIVIYAIGKWK